MLIKLAIFDNENFKDHIIKCCDKHNAQYLSVKDNIFGILTDGLDLSYGSEDSSHENETNVKTYVEIYNCTLQTIKAKTFFFKPKPKIVYTGKTLDNRFFRQIITYCKNHEIEVHFARVLTEVGEEEKIDDIDEINLYFHEDAKAVFKKVGICIDGHTLIFSKRGYVDYSGDYNSFQEDKDLIFSILNAGFGN